MSEKLSWLIEIAYPSLDSIEVYLPGFSAPQHMGDRLPFSDRPLPHINFVFSLPNSGAEVSTIFLRVRNEGTLMAPLSIWSPDAFAESSRLNYAGQAVYFGALLAMMIYNALLWLSLRERVYLEYVLYAAFLSIGLGAVNGMAAQFFWPEIPWLVHYSYLVGFGMAGDDCLVTVAKILQATIARTGDLVARYGGEELVFIAPAINEFHAKDMAQKVCDALADKALLHEMSMFGHVTASIGVASVTPSLELGPEALIKRADEALYQAKAEGRNRAVLYQTS